MLEEQPYGFEDRGKTFLPSCLKRSAPQAKRSSSEVLLKQSAPQGRFLRLCDGFTLIETLVAMMVLAVSLVVILQLFSGGLRSSRLSDEYTRAIFHAREKMEEIFLVDKLIDGELEGEFDDGFKWKAEILCTEPAEEEPTLPFDTFTITVDVSWMEGSREKHFEISTLRVGEKLKAES
ncbi:MAG: type II secretion system protein [Desulfobacterales bacterium]|nr:type II secretion system protein [Desulfobacterales bacterium]